jgi:hypothetical protein
MSSKKIKNIVLIILFSIYCGKLRDGYYIEEWIKLGDVPQRKLGDVPQSTTLYILINWAYHNNEYLLFAQRKA